MALDALKAALPRVSFSYEVLKGHTPDFGAAGLHVLSEAQQTVVTVQKAITLLESNQPE